MSTPSAPRASASRMNWGSTLPEHMSRITRMLAAYFSRETPARSAAVYVHQLQKKATMRGFHSLLISQNSFDLAEHLVVLEEALGDRPRRTGSDARAAALAERFV